MSNKKFQVRDTVVLKVDVFIKKPGAGEVLYAPAGTSVQVMSYDPSLDLMYGVRSSEERYRNAQVSEDMLLTPLEYLNGLPVGLPS